MSLQTKITSAGIKTQLVSSFVPINMPPTKLSLRMSEEYYLQPQPESETTLWMAFQDNVDEQILTELLYNEFIFGMSYFFTSHLKQVSAKY